MLCGRNSHLCNFVKVALMLSTAVLGSTVQQHSVESVLQRDYLKMNSDLKASTSRLWPILLIGLSQRRHCSNLHLAFTIFRLNKQTNIPVSFQIITAIGTLFMVSRNLVLSSRIAKYLYFGTQLLLLVTIIWNQKVLLKPQYLFIILDGTTSQKAQ